MARLLALVARPGSLRQIRRVAAIPVGASQGLVAQVYQAMESDFGMLAPPIALHAPEPKVLAATWLMLRETLLAQGAAARADKETVATAVSLANRCPYCVDVHSAALDGLTRPRGKPVRQVSLPIAPEQRPELIGVAVTFHYLNRMVNVFLADSLLPPELPGPVRAGIRRIVIRVAGRLARRAHRPGRSLGLLPEAPLPPDLTWTRPSLIGGDASPREEHAAPLGATQPLAPIAGAFARADAAIEAAAAAAVPPDVRRIVRTELAFWNGRFPGPSRSWRSDAVTTLPLKQRAAANLALVTALASHQVVDADVDAVRRAGYDDAAIIALTAWSSLAAAKRWGLRLAG